MLINQVRNAVEYQRELPSLLDAHRQQVEHIKNLVVIVEKNRGSRLKLLLLHLARLECSRIDSKSAWIPLQGLRPNSTVWLSTAPRV
jgi:hypothetical protein